MKDATCPALHAAFQAAEKGVPFMPLRGLIGSDVLKHRPDWKVIDNPFGNDDPIVLLPAIKPDVALFHAPMADRDGNVWIGRQRELVDHGACGGEDHRHGGEDCTTAICSTIPTLAAGTLPGFYVESVAVRRARRLAAAAAGSLRLGRRASGGIRPARRDRGRLREYLDQYVYERQAA